MRVVSAQGLGAVTGHAAARRVRWVVVVAVLAAAVATTATVVAPTGRALVHVLVLLASALVARSLDRLAGWSTLVVAELGVLAGGLVALTPVVVPAAALLVAEVAVTIGVGLWAVVALTIPQRAAAGALQRAQALDDAIAGFADTAGSGTIIQAVRDGMRTVVPDAGVVEVGLGDTAGGVDAIVALLLHRVRDSGARAILPAGFSGEEDAVLVGFPILHGDRVAGGVVVRLPDGVTTDDLDLLTAFLHRVAPALDAHRALAAAPAPAPAPAPASASPRPDDELVARAAHDLRVPLSSLAGTVETLAAHGEQMTPEQRTELYDVLTRSTRRVSAWVTTLLEGSLQGEAVTAEPRPVRLSDLLEEAAEAADAAIVGLRVELQPTDLVVDADPGLAIRALGNLLANAGHHATAGGHLEVMVDRHGDEVKVRVQDHGPGFDEHALASVQAGAARAPRGGGSEGAGLGIGLASVQSLVASWDGSFGVEETPGGGATVWFTLPLAAGQEAPRERTREHNEVVRWTVVTPDPSLLREISRQG